MRIQWIPCDRMTDINFYINYKETFVIQLSNLTLVPPLFWFVKYGAFQFTFNCHIYYWRSPLSPNLWTVLCFSLKLYKNYDQIFRNLEFGKFKGTEGAEISLVHTSINLLFKSLVFYGGGNIHPTSTGQLCCLLQILMWLILCNAGSRVINHKIIFGTSNSKLADL